MSIHLVAKLIEAEVELARGESHAKHSSHPEVTRAVTWAHVASKFFRK